ncbi:MAG: HD-GYP domain-containing protein [Chloroflexi bacterium]|nr:MAG: HD-GYP domain-containing protein [Chloroflexota bacterium]TMF28123.1 MAG: HD-GYP domain-containing protein [Chloroflexota bacterium]
MRGNGRLDLYVGTVACAGVIALLAGSRALEPAKVDPLMLAVLVVLAVVAQRVPVFLFRSSAISVSVAAVIAAYVLYGTGAAVWVSLAQAVVNSVTPRRKPFRKIAFNFGSFAVSAFVAGELYRLTGGMTPPTAIAPTLIAVGLSAAAYFLVNTSLTALAIGMSEAQSVLSVWRTNYSWMPINFGATAVQGAALALAYQALGMFGVFVFTVPLCVAWFSFRLYMAKSTEVRQRNEELSTVNELLRQTNDRLEESHISVIGALIGALEAKEAHLSGHAATTMHYSVEVGRKLGLGNDEIAAIKLGALFHDVGKIGVPEQLLSKPAELTEAEWVEMRAHPTIGASLLGNVPMLDRIRPVVLAHHENFDGTGYPHGLKGSEIPLAAQIISVADAYDAMTSERPYRVALRSKPALRELRANAGTQFNPVVVEAFIQVVIEERRSAARGKVTVNPHEHRHVYQQALEAVKVAS